MLGTMRDSEVEGACDLGKQAQKSRRGKEVDLGGAGGGSCVGGAGDVFLGQNIMFGAEV